MHIGTVVKIIHNKQKHYAVIAEYLGKDAKLRVPEFQSTTNQVFVVELTKPLKEIRTINEYQSGVFAHFLRQLVGIRYEEPTSKKIAPALGKKIEEVDTGDSDTLD